MPDESPNTRPEPQPDNESRPRLIARQWLGVGMCGFAILTGVGLAYVFPLIQSLAESQVDHSGGGVTTTLVIMPPNFGIPPWLRLILLAIFVLGGILWILPAKNPKR
jgi:hypothetical protein